MAATKKKKPAQQNARKTGQKHSTQPPKEPIRREIGALVCLLLTIFTFFGYFQSNALFIAFVRNLMMGLTGYGFYILPPALAMCAFVLAFHKGRPVALRVTCTLLLPVLVGALLHVFLCKQEFAWKWAMIPALYTSGMAGVSGGVISGFVAVSFTALLGKICSVIVYLILLAFLVPAMFNKTVPGIIRQLKARERHPRREYTPVEVPEPAVYPAEPAGFTEWPERRQKKPNIDIPVDGPIKPPAENGKRESLFRKEPSVPTPDQILQRHRGPAQDVEEVSREETVYPVREERLPSAFKEDAAHTKLSYGAPAATVQQQPCRAEEASAAMQEPAAASSAASPSKRLSGAEAEAAMRAVEAEIAQHSAEAADGGAYVFPPIDLLSPPAAGRISESRDEIAMNRTRLESTISSFGINAHIQDVTRGPTVTRYELELEQGVKLTKLTSLADDIALSLGAVSVRIAPIPDKISIVGIEVPNKVVSTIYLREIVESAKFRASQSKLSFAIGRDIGGEAIVGNIAKLPHLLIAGTTGSGKSVCMNSLILSLLYKARPDEVKLIMIDPKMVEMGIYNGIPHLYTPVVTDPKKAAGALQWAVVEMMKRYRSFSEYGVRDLESYNALCVKKPEEMQALPQVVIVIDELADLMMVASKEVEDSVCRIAQMGRAAGMHLVIATQRPSADVITGLMKANIPSRIAFAVASAMESRIIMDTAGAEKLVGHGDMLYLPLGAGKPLRVQGTYVSDVEREKVIDFIKAGSAPQYSDEVTSEIERHMEDKKGSAAAEAKPAPSVNESAFGDELFPDAVDVVLESGQASVSMLQRRLKLGYSRAARLVDQMEEMGIVGAFEGSKPRKLLVSKEQWAEMKYAAQNRGEEAAAQEPVPDEIP